MHKNNLKYINNCTEMSALSINDINKYILYIIYTDICIFISVACGHLLLTLEDCHFLHSISQAIQQGGEVRPVNTTNKLCYFS